jgi:putative ATP-dependent endonuclease of OLD family
MYLSRLTIENYRGIEKLEMDFDPSINIIIGENGCCKSAVVDAIRLLYNLGDPLRQISVRSEDFHEKREVIENGQRRIQVTKATKISITYEFRDLSEHQKGAFYEYLVLDPKDEKNDFAKISITYEDRGTRYPHFTFNTGNVEGQKADYKTFELFQHYYLGALRDSTKDLLTARGNVLGRVIKRLVDRADSGSQIEEIIKDANDRLLERNEVTTTRDNVNNNLDHIFKRYPDNKIGLQIEAAKSDYIVNAIKPYLPHNVDTLRDEGFNLWQNSLDFNNLIYIATVLGDI